ncbi:DUF4307 domain-containing protein [Micromonospora sp. WMMD882]|uniref:DUF4307 domain-containing protein n=1 Tax=Micromonospora sp. WMMD882 TaxID=3015151 RepID=UPI00248C0132|nr:DUF4307 domain-containing protein [Micromonospora sp. WMMD882]WBB77406.1 DUF4307 domain-containing protein [Micromonospora sp. WMMD882]
MTETHATTAPGAPVFPPGRYGRRRQARRRRPWLTALLVAVVVVALGLAAFRLYQRYGDPTYDAQVITYTDVTDTGILVDFQVNVPPGGSAVCLLRARSVDGAEVAREQVPVTADGQDRVVRLQHRLTTSARPFIGEVVRCHAPS